MINKDDYIELRSLGGGSTAITYLIYHIKDEKLYVLKKQYIQDDQEFEKLRKREFNKYKSKINHPFLPKFYGITKEKQFLVFEYINGQPLSNTDISKYTEREVFSIIIQILSVFDYLHEKHFIYRDLKPDNVMIDLNKTAVLIDFDRMLNENEMNNKHTNDFASEYFAPETNSGKFTNKCDIFSIGKLINYIMNKFNSNYLNKYPQINNLIDQCCKVKPKERPTVSEITSRFYE